MFSITRWPFNIKWFRKYLWFTAQKGPNFRPSLEKLETDLTVEMLASYVHAPFPFFLMFTQFGIDIQRVLENSQLQKI